MELWDERDLLMIPGPTPVSSKVLREMSKPIMSHRSKDFSEILKECVEMMKEIFRTKGDVFIVTGSGTACMDAAISNTVSEGDKVLVPVYGKFSQRFVDIAKSYGADVIEVKLEWGKALRPDLIRDMLRENPDVEVVAVVHNETSTGIRNPIREIGKVIREESEALYVLDVISSLGGDDIRVDDFGIDLAIAGSQKCLATPPGLAMISVSERAWERIEEKGNRRRTYYLDLKKYKRSLEKEVPETPYTPSVPLFYALREALDYIVNVEGLENSIKRHEIFSDAVRSAVREMGLELFPERGYESRTVTAVKIPEGIEDKELRGRMRSKYRVIIAGGQDHLSGKIFRIGHMGSITEREVLITISALEMTLKDLGFDIELGKGIGKAEEIISTGMDQIAK